jgi:hypothetical protein
MTALSEVAKLLSHRVWLVDGKDLRLRYMNGMGWANGSLTSFYQFLTAREELRQLRADIRRKLEASDSYVDCDDSVIRDEIAQCFSAHRLALPTHWDGVPSSSATALGTSSDWQQLYPSDALELLGSAILWLDEVIHLILRHFARPSFPHQMILRERKWSILHGSHPPKKPARLAVRPRGTREGVLNAACLPN